ncbi:MAG: class chitinase [Bacteroidetes bacterium]|jgi:chitinase|nr:class chitinase [Bacteroidota bacterium]
MVESSMTRHLTLVLAGAGALTLLLFGRSPSMAHTQDTLPGRLIVGYWHNFSNAAGIIRLAQVPDAYDVINVAFAEPTAALGSTMRFIPAPELYVNTQDFVDEIALLKSRGKKVLISIGGANAPIQIKSGSDVQNFVSSMRSIITTFGFDGIDIDLEGQSLVLEVSDKDFRTPTSPLIVNLINALQTLLGEFPQGLLLSAAPETAFVQGGYGTYGGIYGCYLPVIHALRDKLTYIHVQHYNTGSMFGRDGNLYQPATRDFHVAMADMLLAGFTVDSFGKKIFFPPLSPAQVLIGLPASADAAGSGFTPSPDILAALDYLYLGKSFGGAYHIASPQGYPGFRGLMTWSINWDVYSKQIWSRDYRAYLDNLVTDVADIGFRSPGIEGRKLILEPNYPNPFNPVTVIRYSLLVKSPVRLEVCSAIGETVRVLTDEIQDAGIHEVLFDGSGLASGIYFCRLQGANEMRTVRIALVR